MNKNAKMFNIFSSKDCTEVTKQRMYLFEWENGDLKFVSQQQARNWPELLIQYLEANAVNNS